MKRTLVSILICVFLTFFIGCDSSTDSNNDTIVSSDEATISKDEASAIFDYYNECESLIVTEITTATTLKNETLTATRVSHINKNNSYYYGIINQGNEQVGYEYLASKNNYYRSNNDSKVEYVGDLTNIFIPLGFEKIFDESINYSINDNHAKVLISGSNVSKYENLFNNVNEDLLTDYVLNLSFFNVDIEFTSNSISKITFNLTQIFSSYCSSVTKIITFSEYDNIETEINVLSTSYSVKLGDTLETYVIEMTYQYADSIFIHSGDFDMLIDAGQSQDGSNVNNIIKTKMTDDCLDVLVVTHGHLDHYGGITNGALDGISSIGLIIDYGYVDSGAYLYEKIKESYIEDGADYHSAYDCVNSLDGATKIYQFSEDLSFEILDTGQYVKTGSSISSDANENDCSVVLKLVYKNNSYLYTGDLSGDSYYDTLSTKEDIANMTVYKAAHHGSSTYNSNSSEFLNLINPDICVVSAAITAEFNDLDSSYRHQAHPSYAFVRNILNTSKISVTKNLYFNGTMGTIHLVDDGVSLPTVEGLGVINGYFDSDGNFVTGEENLKFVETKFYQMNYY